MNITDQVLPKHSYRDSTLALKDRKLGVFEIGRDIGGWVEALHPKSSQVSWQSRSLLEKISGLCRARRNKPTVIINFDDQQHLLLRYVHVHFASQSKEIKVISTPVQRLSTTGLLTAEIDKCIDQCISSSSFSDVISANISKDESHFSIVVIPPGRPEIVRRVAVEWVTGARGVILYRDYSYVKTPWPFDYLRDNNLVMIETADGFGECWSL